MTLSEDERWMQAALQLGRRHLGRTSTNPSVGCLIVKNNSVIGRGITAISGRPHAETQALAEAGRNAEHATAYVTLEPCAHHGKTPPCCEALVSAKLSRVVIACHDPNPQVAGQGMAYLRAAGVEVVEHICAEHAQKNHAAHILRIKQKRPFIQGKLAVTEDGYIGSSDERIQITSIEAQNFTHRLRSQADAILVGRKTISVDQPQLNVRLPGLENRSPKKMTLGDEIQSTSDFQRIEGGLKLHSAITNLAHDNITRLLIEGGVATLESFLKDHLLDEVILIRSPRKIDLTKSNLISARNFIQKIEKNFSLYEQRMLGKDILQRFWNPTCLQD